MDVEEEDVGGLERGVELLEEDRIRERVRELVGRGIDQLMSKVGKGGEKKIYRVVEKCVKKGGNGGLWRVENEGKGIG